MYNTFVSWWVGYFVLWLHATKCPPTRKKPLHTSATEECTKYDLVTAAPSVFDWPNIHTYIHTYIMIGPGGLLLVIPTCLQFQFQFYWWGCKKVDNPTFCWKQKVLSLPSVCLFVNQLFWICTMYWVLVLNWFWWALHSIWLRPRPPPPLLIFLGEK